MKLNEITVNGTELVTNVLTGVQIGTVGYAGYTIIANTGVKMALLPLLIVVSAYLIKKVIN
jgi:hypothetical protein